jgi:hypothetical protein
MSCNLSFKDFPEICKRHAQLQLGHRNELLPQHTHQGCKEQTNDGLQQQIGLEDLPLKRLKLWIWK